MALTLQANALLLHASAATPVAAVHALLAPANLELPIDPLEPGLTLGDLVATNAGGRRQLRYGTISRYLRAATIENAAGRAMIGGPTLKRATGYGLNRALVGAGMPAGYQLIDLTLSVRPLPAKRQVVLLFCTDPVQACHFTQRLLQAGIEPTAAALASTMLLIELEGHPNAIAHDLHRIEALASTMAIRSERTEAGTAWQHWEHLALRWPANDPQRVERILPRAALPLALDAAQQAAQRAGVALSVWGDVGVGQIFFCSAEAQSGSAFIDNTTLCATLCPPVSVPGPQGDETRHFASFWKKGFFGGQKPPPPPPPEHEPFIQQLRTIVGAGAIVTRRDDLLCYLQDASIAQATGLPLAVVLPTTTAEVSALVGLAATAGVPVVSRGAGSGLAGGATPSAHALIVALSRMQRITIDPAQMVAHVAAGVITGDIQAAAAVHGLFYPPDPSSLGVSTIGGNIACNAGGPRCLKYGVTADYVLALTAVFADGNIVRIGNGLSGQSEDASLLQLLIGSEGTLAVITEATLRLIREPAARRTTLAIFDTLDQACQLVEMIMSSGIVPASLEVMDDTTIGVVEDYLQIGLPRDAGALLLLLADGSPEAVEAEAAVLAELAQQGQARSVRVARTSSDEAALWRARRAIAPALARVRPNRLGEDICVPIHQIAECVRRIKGVAERYGLPIAVFGHAGDGNLHPNILFDNRNPAEVARCWQAAEAIFQLALELGGTLSGEHGIGTLKRTFMPQAFDAVALALQRSIKAHYDPRNSLNPGKVLP